MPQFHWPWNEYERHTQNQYNNERTEEQFNEHQRHIDQLLEQNPEQSRETIEEVYWQSLGMTPLAMKFQLKECLVSNDEYDNLPTPLN